jgi:tetratricopeptide (TPR) repeat protein
VLAVLNRYEDRVALLTDLVALPAAAGSAEVEGMLRGDLAAALRDSGNLSDARTAALAALDLAHRSSPHNSGQRIKLLGVIVSVLVELGEANHAEIYVKDMLQAADEAQSPGLLGRAHWVAANTYAQTGQGELARKHLAEAHRALTSPTMPLREWMRFCRSSAAVLLDVNDDLPEIDRWLLNAETSARMLAMPIEQHRVAAVRARYFLAAGQPQQAYDMVAPLLERSCEGLSPPELIRLRLLHARAMAELGRPDDAAESMRTLAIEAEALGALPLAVEVWRHIDALRTSRG